MWNTISAAVPERKTNVRAFTTFMYMFNGSLHVYINSFIHPEWQVVASHDNTQNPDAKQVIVTYASVLLSTEYSPFVMEKLS